MLTKLETAYVALAGLEHALKELKATDPKIHIDTVLKYMSPAIRTLDELRKEVE